MREFISWLWRRFGDTDDAEARAAIRAMETGELPAHKDLMPAGVIGLELRNRPRRPSATAARILKLAARRLTSSDLLFEYINERGYSTAATRALLDHHYQKVMLAKIGTEAHLVGVDLKSAIKRLHIRDQTIVRLLGLGFTGPEIVIILGSQDSNASRVTAPAVRALSRQLQGSTDDLDVGG